MVEQIRHYQEDSRVASANHFVGNGSSQMGFARSVGASQQQPPFRSRGKAAGDLERSSQKRSINLRNVATVSIESGEGHLLKMRQVADPHQLTLPSQHLIAGAALAAHGPSEVRMPYRKIQHDKTLATADWANGASRGVKNLPCATGRRPGGVALSV